MNRDYTRAVALVAAFALCIAFWIAVFKAGSAVVGII